MAIDKKVVKAVYAAVQGYNQPDKVAKSITSWLEEVSDVPDRLSDQDEVKVYLERVLNIIQVSRYVDEMEGLE